MLDSICIPPTIPFQSLLPVALGESGRMDYPKQLAAWQNGDVLAGNALCSALEVQLRAIAAAKLRKERHSSLSSGDLVNEAIMKLYQHNVLEVTNRVHILALASKLMRQILIDQARKRNSDKRHHYPVTLSTNIAEWEMPVDVMDIHFAMDELAEIDAQRAEIVEMRFFGGMTNAEVAAVLGLSEATVKLRWAVSRAWLFDRLKHGYGAV